jgi:hypothetical protein
MKFLAALILSAVFVMGTALPASGGAAAQADVKTVSLASAAIVVGDRAADLERLAAKELQRYLYRMSGSVLPLTGESAWKQEPKRPMILLGTPQSNAVLAAVTAGAGIDASQSALGDQGFVVKTLDVQQRPVAAIAAATPVGVLYGAYTLLEQMGVGFYLGGDALPGHDLPLELPASLEVRQKPVFAVRGSLPWYNFLNSPTTWDLDDFKYFFDQISKMKQNFVGFHTYDSEPLAPYVKEGKLVYAEPLVTSKTYAWGAVRGLTTGQFGFGTGDYFDQELFGSRATTESKDREDAIRRTQALLAAGLEYGRRRGVRVCVGFEVTGDPTRPESQAALEARLRELVRAYPMLDYVWLWQSESLGGGADLPPLDSPLNILVSKQGKAFEYLKDPRRVAEAVRVSEYIRLGHSILRRIAPRMQLIVSGWGGDKWMRFGDFYEGLDKTLPPDVIFAALDNIDPGAEPNVAAVYGKLSPQRQRWPIPWYEADGSTCRDQTCPQANTRNFVPVSRDARAKGCQGLLAIHWRSRDVEETAAYAAQFAWEPSLSYEDFYRRFAAKSFGREYAEEMGRILRQLEALGPRWTGGGGQSECGYFAWFECKEMPKPENLATLARIRQRLGQIQAEMELKGRREGLERMRHLVTTIDWVVRYDAAALKLYPKGPVPKLIAEAEELKAKGGAQAAAQKAQAAWAALASSGFREAIVTFPPKITTRGEFGALATINVKACGAYLALEDRIRTLWPAAPAADNSPRAGLPLHVVVKTPPDIQVQRRPIVVRAAVIGPVAIREVKLGYRAPGEKAFHFAPMNAVFRKTYEGTIPAEAVTLAGIEFYVEARDAAGSAACAPKGYPAVTYSASVVPWPGPSVYLTQCRRLPKPGQDYPVRANVIGYPDAAKLDLYYRVASQSAFKRLPMTRLFYGSFEASVPACEVTPAGIEYYVEVTGSQGARWIAPATGAAGPQKEAPDLKPLDAVAGLKAEITGPFEVTLSWSKARDNGEVALYEVHRAQTARFSSGKDTLLTTTFHTVHYDCRVCPGQTYWYAVRPVDAWGTPMAEAAYASVAVPQYPPPAAPPNVQTAACRGRIRMTWDAMEPPVIGYNLYRAAPGAKPELVNRIRPLIEGLYLDAAVKEGTPYTYTVRAIDRGGQEGQASKPMTVSALPRIEGPVFVAHFENSPDSESGLKGKLEGKATYAPGVVGQALDLRNGGWDAFPHDPAFDLTGDLTVEAWVKFDVSFDAVGPVPMILSHGQWHGPGFFFQASNGALRFWLGDLNDCVGGELESGKWYYFVGTYDLQQMRAYVNGREVRRYSAPAVNLAPRAVPFYIGRYVEQAKHFEFRGMIDEVKIYHRARSAEEIRKEYEAVIAKQPAANR